MNKTEKNLLKHDFNVWFDSRAVKTKILAFYFFLSFFLLVFWITKKLNYVHYHDDHESITTRALAY